MIQLVLLLSTIIIHIFSTSFSYVNTFHVSIPSRCKHINAQVIILYILYFASVFVQKYILNGSLTHELCFESVNFTHELPLRNSVLITILNKIINNKENDKNVSAHKKNDTTL